MTTPRTPFKNGAEHCSIADIVTSICAPSKLIEAQRQLEVTKIQLAELRDKIAELNSKRRDTNTGATDQELMDLEKERRRLNDQAAQLRRTIRPLREAQAANIQTVLRPRISAIAETAHQAAVQLADSLAELEEVNRQLGALGATGIWSIVPPELPRLVSRLERLACT